MIITDELFDELFARAEAISTYQDLGEFHEFLESKYDRGLIDKKDLGEFIGDASDMFGSIDVLETQEGRPVPDQPTWNLVGNIILAAVLRD